MKRISILSILLTLLACSYAQTSNEDQIWDYIDNHKDLAMQEMEVYKIPASITLAQAIYATNAGNNKIAREANNHFGITCHANEWTGETYYETDNHSADYCFRKYATVAESYRDHSLFLAKRNRYAILFENDITDFRAWSVGLKTLGYSGNAKYADTLISLIEKFHLDRYDRKVAAKIGVTTPNEPTVAVAEPSVAPLTEVIKQEAQEAKPQPTQVTPTETQPEPTQTTTEPSPQVAPQVQKIDGINYFTLDPNNVPYKSAYYPYTSRKVYENNKTKFIIAKTGDTYAKLAASMQLTEKNLRLYNDVYDNSEPVEDEVVYLEMKGTKSETEYHILAEGDTYRYIAQRYGIQLKLLIKRNSGVLSSYQYGDKICIGCK